VSNSSNQSWNTIGKYVHQMNKDRKQWEGTIMHLRWSGKPDETKTSQEHYKQTTKKNLHQGYL